MDKVCAVITKSIFSDSSELRLVRYSENKRYHGVLNIEWIEMDNFKIPTDVHNILIDNVSSYDGDEFIKLRDHFSVYKKLSEDFQKQIVDVLKESVRKNG